MPSALSTAWLVTLVAILAGAFVWTAGRASRAVAVMPVRTRADRGVAIALLGLWLVPSGVLAGAGLLSSFDRLPPPLMQVVAATTVATSVVACSAFGRRFAGRAGLAGLVGFQVFRLPLELLLHRLCDEGVLPVQMTYEGANFDIVTGLSAAAMGAWAAWGRPPRWALWVWNVAGLALLLTIMTVAVVSAPGPLRLYDTEPANRIVATFPFIWIPVFFVQAAWFGHLLVFRQLWRGQPIRQSDEPG